MPYTYKSNYPIDMVHKALYFQNIETDIIPCDKTTDFSGYDMLVIPPLYVATDQLLLAIDEFVQSGGHVVMMHKAVTAMSTPQFGPPWLPGRYAKPAASITRNSPLSVTYH